MDQGEEFGGACGTARLTDFLAEVTADCPRRQSVNMSDQCAEGMPDLARIA
jgi:hypothetical protein